MVGASPPRSPRASISRAGGISQRAQKRSSPPSPQARARTGQRSGRTRLPPQRSRMSPPLHVLPQSPTFPQLPLPHRSRTPHPPLPCTERSSLRPLPRKAPPHSTRHPVLPAPPPAAAAATAATASATPIKPPAGQLITICKQLKLAMAQCLIAPRKERHAKECRGSPLMLWKTPLNERGFAGG